MRANSVVFLVAVISSPIGAACNRGRPVPPPPTMGALPADRTAPLPTPVVPPPPAPQGHDALGWDLPKSWSESRGSGMRFATLKPPVEGKIDVSVVTLPGLAGGELGNVNRWRNQIGLPPIDDAERAHMRQDVASKAGTIALYDFASSGANQQRMIAGMLFTGDRSWFLKMVGDDAAVAATRPDFLKLLQSLRLPSGRSQ